MRHKLFVTLLATAALSGAHARAGGTQKDMPRQDAQQKQQGEQQQEEEHIIASPNPTIDDSKTTDVGHGEISSTRVQPVSATTAAPMKEEATRPKRVHRSRQ